MRRQEKRRGLSAPIRSAADLGERGLLARIARRHGGTASGVILGIGDDAAVLSMQTGRLVVSCDMLVEHVDFERRWATARDIGHKSAAINLSDLAAMGATPRGLLLGIALPPDTPVRDIDRITGACAALGRRFGAPLVGGDLSRSSADLVVSVTAFGELPESTSILRRHAAQPGDRVLVSGELGGAAIALAALRAGHTVTPALARRQLRPMPRVALASALAARGLVHSAADVSDGLVADAQHLLPSSIGLDLDVEALPIGSATMRAASALGLSATAAALYGGEDFELVLALPPAATAAAQRLASRLGERLTVIGTVRGSPGVRLHGAGNPTEVKSGFDHFARDRSRPARAKRLT